MSELALDEELYEEKSMGKASSFNTNHAFEVLFRVLCQLGKMSTSRT